MPKPSALSSFEVPERAALSGPWLRRSSTRRALRYKVSRPTRTCPRAHVLPYSPLLCPSLHRHLPDRRGRCVNLLLGLHRRALSPLPAGAAAAPAPHSPVTYRVARPVLVARGSLPRVVECAWWMTRAVAVQRRTTENNIKLFAKLFALAQRVCFFCKEFESDLQRTRKYIFLAQKMKV